MARKREFTNWIFGRELRDSRELEERPDEERAKPYVITPLGTRVRRVLFCGLVSQKNADESMTRVTVTDGTGNFYISAFNSDFGMQAKAMVDALEINDQVLVMGRVSTYQNEGKTYFNVNPEIAIKVDSVSMDYWRMKTLHIARRKIYAIRMARNRPGSTAADIKAAGYSDLEAESAMKAMEKYPDYDLQEFESAIAAQIQPAAKEEHKSSKDFILQYIQANDTDGRGCRYEDLLAASQNASISQNELDDLLNSLGSDGEIFEVSLKRYKVI
ncbi:MAG: OB-fold nucleic acid binding domain-containing protein [Candidatus Thermoplasmatota archaeon]|nr:OB-fold nucleic acid binding domain-containing protein [Candidatus Thermoplasmatota archaeon]